MKIKLFLKKNLISGFCVFVLISGKQIQKSGNSNENVLVRKLMHMSSEN